MSMYYDWAIPPVSNIYSNIIVIDDDTDVHDLDQALCLKYRPKINHSFINHGPYNIATF